MFELSKFYQSFVNKCFKTTLNVAIDFLKVRIIFCWRFDYVINDWQRKWKIVSQSVLFTKNTILKTQSFMRSVFWFYPLLSNPRIGAKKWAHTVVLINLIIVLHILAICAENTFFSFCFQVFTFLKTRLRAWNCNQSYWDESRLFLFAWYFRMIYSILMTLLPDFKKYNQSFAFNEVLCRIMNPNQYSRRAKILLSKKWTNFCIE